MNFLVKSTDMALEEFYATNAKTFEQFCLMTTGTSTNGILYLIHKDGQIQCIFINTLAEMDTYFNYKIAQIEAQTDQWVIFIQEK